MIREALLAGLLLITVIGGRAEAAACAPAASALDEAICCDPEPAALDARLNTLYGDVRKQATPVARADLLRRQRAWRGSRDRCPATDIPCLDEHDQARTMELQALAATAAADGGRLADARLVFLQGSWRVTTIEDPERTGGPDQAVLKRTLELADLPAVGSVVQSGPGRLCQPGEPCAPFGWQGRTPGAVDGGQAIARALSLPGSAAAFVGSTGSAQSYVLLVPRGPGNLLAILTLCAADRSDCRTAWEVWSPVSPDAAMRSG